jgi:hypothetical protein
MKQPKPNTQIARAWEEIKETPTYKSGAPFKARDIAPN